MRRIITFLLLAATATGPLAAQAWNQPDQRPQGGDRDRPGDRGDQRGDGPRGDGPRGDAPRGDGPRGDRAAPPVREGQPQRQYGQLGPRGDDRRDGPGRRGDNGAWRNDGRNDNRGDWRDGRPDGNRGGYDPRGYGQRGPAGRDQAWRDQAWRGNPGGIDRRGGWNAGWRDDRRYDWQGYRAGNRALYRAPRYYGPQGYSYNRWSRGYRVEPYFYGQGYWINDPYRYRLPPAYGDYRWVRYYDDVALIDIRSGLIEDIIYSFFYR